jgi:hypothetical protein
MEAIFRVAGTPNPRKIKKPSRVTGKARIRLVPGAMTRVIPSGQPPCGRAGAFASGIARVRKSLQILLNAH